MSHSERSNNIDKSSRISTETNDPSQGVDRSVNFLTSEEVEAILGNYKVHFERIKAENRELKEKVELTLEKKVEIEKDYNKVYSENAALQKETIYFQDLSLQLDEKLAIKEKESATEEISRINTYKSLAELDNTDNCQEKKISANPRKRNCCLTS